VSSFAPPAASASGDEPPAGQVQDLEAETRPARRPVRLGTIADPTGPPAGGPEQYESNGNGQRRVAN